MLLNKFIDWVVDSLSPCQMQTASRSHDLPPLFLNGGGAPRSAHALILSRNVDVAVSMSWRHVDLSKARRLAVARQKLSGRRSFSTVLNQVCHHLLILPSININHLSDSVKTPVASLFLLRTIVVVVTGHMVWRAKASDSWQGTINKLQTTSDNVW